MYFDRLMHLKKDTFLMEEEPRDTDLNKKLVGVLRLGILADY